MHPKDRRFWLAILWAGSIGGALAVGCYIAWASGQMPWQAAVPGIAVGLLVPLHSDYDSLGVSG